MIGLRFRTSLLLITAVGALVASAGCSSAQPENPTPTATSPTGEFPTLDIEVTVVPAQISAGGDFTVTTTAGGSGLAQYTLLIDEMQHSVLRYDGTLVADIHPTTFPPVERSASANLASWTLTATTAGDFTIRVFVTGEVSVRPGGPFVFTHGSGSVSLSVLP